MSMPSPSEPGRPAEVIVGSDDGSASDAPLGLPTEAPAAFSVTVGHEGRAARRQTATPAKPRLRGRYFLVAGAICFFLALVVFFVGGSYSTNGTSDSQQWTGALAQICSLVPCLVGVGLLTFGAAYGLIRRLPQ